ncbi:ethanolamine ammonia-lyase subunit EutC [Methylobacterium gossipiicola]|uniref:Ethanolamine ammonia-lyase small subunit n=1 Tax=Methylobacterium gossipiicola TaxID=582675 RepID=A0A1I2XG05_9HYPH|nr:ethanolamine ammonia-lyase subunit EutC [Methylobacterium gossipiicola]SFH11987.1 Ethanolamine ammonia-lyase light chain [Methylobacterium gossipiicola]
MSDDAPPPGAVSGETIPAATDPWARLRATTSARIGLGRSGDAMPLGAVLDFQLDHARARDAVHTALDTADLEAALAPRPVVRVRSAAPDRATYLRRPDLGRVLADGITLDAIPGGIDLVFVVGDGLSAGAVQSQAAPLIHACLDRLADLSVAPIVVATQARVALGDPIGAALGARLCAVVLGERPGLSVAESLGIYLTHDPQPGRRDAERNCISNIHARGLSLDRAADTLAWLAREALRRGVTGVHLKENLGQVSLGREDLGKASLEQASLEQTSLGPERLDGEARPALSPAPEP